MELDGRGALATMHELPENEPLITSSLQPYSKMNHGMDEGPSSLHRGGGFFEEGDCGLARSPPYIHPPTLSKPSSDRPTSRSLLICVKLPSSSPHCLRERERSLPACS